MLRSDVFRNSHRASVVAILGEDAPSVEAKGTKFYNEDKWTGRRFVANMCSWARDNPSKTPTEEHVKAWVHEANNAPFKPSERRIVTAAIPSDLTPRVALTLIGGAYHEAWHTKYSRRHALIAREMTSLVLPRWPKIPDWGKVEALLQEWNNVVEDIRIERCGTQTYPGTYTRMEFLQDFILDQEASGREYDFAKGLRDRSARAATIVMMAFRDLGLGYTTSKQTEALKLYQELNPTAYAMVREGPLTPLLEQAIHLSDQDDLACITMAFDIIILLSDLTNPDELQKAQAELSSVSGEVTCVAGGEGEGEPLDVTTSSDLDGEGSVESPTPSRFGGGHEWDENPVTPWAIVAEEILTQGPANVMDVSMALEEAFEEARNREDNKCAMGEKAWRPYNPTLDSVAYVEPSVLGQEADLARVDELLDTLTAETSFLRSRMRRIFRAVEQQDTTHGVRRGQALSERMFVDSYTSLRGGTQPSRAYQRTGERVDTSMAAVVIIDQSSSMGYPSGGMSKKQKLQEATRCMLAVVEPLDGLGCATFAVGFRDGRKGERVFSPEHHRFEGVHHDVFKDFRERFQAVKWRFANTRAVGGTPMADGIQFGLDLLSSRTEGHRMLFVITDGQPNFSDPPVIRHQVRIAKESGVHVLGVGIGPEAAYVKDTFPDHVYADTINLMPDTLLHKLNEILDFRGIHRGKSIRSTNGIG